MSWAALFSLTNLVAMAGWLALAVLPRRPIVRTLILYAGVALLCAAYAAMFAALLAGIVDPGQVKGAQAVDVGDYGIAGIRALFMSDAGIVVGWTHYLAFDLLVGLWIARDADAKRAGRLIQLPFLIATLMAGPVGLLGWLAARGWLKRSAAP